MNPNENSEHDAIVRERFEWRVRYRRRGWKYAHERIFQSAPPAERLQAKLRKPHWRYAPIVEMCIERRVVGEWERVLPQRPPARSDSA